MKIIPALAVGMVLMASAACTETAYGDRGYRDRGYYGGASRYDEPDNTARRWDVPIDRGRIEAWKDRLPRDKIPARVRDPNAMSESVNVTH